MSNAVLKLAMAAKAATREMAKAPSEQKNAALQNLMQNIQRHRETIMLANRHDRTSAQGLTPALLERLSLENRLDSLIGDIEQVLRLPDPVGEIFEEQILPNGLHLAKCRTPLGVLGAIYESRPNVTLDISALSVKSGNCAILRGGSETLHTNRVLVELIQNALLSAGLPAQAIQLIASPERAEVKAMLALHEYIDLIIPRGSETLQQFCREHSMIPVVTGGIGICHLFVDESADLQKALPVIANAKMQRPTVCNALDTLLVHAAIAPTFLPRVITALNGVDFRLDPKAAHLVQAPTCHRAGSKDWDTEWLSLILGIKVVENFDEAIEHIHEHSTGHSDAILTDNPTNADRFLREIDSAAVYVNASTRFTDGGQFGLGAEVAISTQKLHARGPMGLHALTSYKWIARGSYQSRPS